MGGARGRASRGALVVGQGIELGRLSSRARLGGQVREGRARGRESGHVKTPTFASMALLVAILVQSQPGWGSEDQVGS